MHITDVIRQGEFRNIYKFVVRKQAETNLQTTRSLSFRGDEIQ
jgi:hypothetical protein